METTGKIRRSQRGDYYIADEKSDSENLWDIRYMEPNDRDIINMVKDSMYRERQQDKDFIYYLKDEIEFLKSEIREKNIQIKRLMEPKDNLIETRSYIKSNSNNVDQLVNNAHNCIENKNESMVIKKVNEDDNTPKIEICGDSHLNNINPKGLSSKGNIIVRNYPGSNTNDLKSHIIPTINKKRDVIILHCGCNDLTSEVDTISNYQGIVNKIKKQSAHTKIAISSLFTRKDKVGMEKKVMELNVRLKSFCQDNLIDYISNDNVNESCLGKAKLHLNKKGKSVFARNLIDYTKSLN